MRKIKYVISIILLFSSLYLAWGTASGLESFESMELYIAEKPFQLEIADNPNLRRQGLMFRSELSKHAGMIFIYPETGHHRIWMKNTHIPLTVVWIDDKATVIGIKKLQPCKQESCPSYGIQLASKFIIELNVNFDDLKLGDRLLAILDI